MIANLTWEGLTMLFVGVFTVFTLFTLFFDGAGGGLSVKTYMLRCDSANRFKWINYSTDVLFMQVGLVRSVSPPSLPPPGLVHRPLRGRDLRPSPSTEWVNNMTPSSEGVRERSDRWGWFFCRSEWAVQHP